MLQAWGQGLLPRVGTGRGVSERPSKRRELNCRVRSALTPLMGTHNTHADGVLRPTFPCDLSHVHTHTHTHTHTHAHTHTQTHTHTHTRALTQSKRKARAEGINPNAAAAGGGAMADDAGGDIFREAAAAVAAEAARRPGQAAAHREAVDPELDLAAAAAERYSGHGTAHAAARVSDGGGEPGWVGGGDPQDQGGWPTGGAAPGGCFASRPGKGLKAGARPHVGRVLWCRGGSGHAPTCPS